ncbi:MAG TPA: hypothetical protein ENJ08_09535 [Gammaproteobacteria bacterium]|nr:hypothetical protein [Gammaproteobacteria bacterium]
MKYIIDVDNKGLDNALDDFISFLSQPDFLKLFESDTDDYVHYALNYTFSFTPDYGDLNSDIPIHDYVLPAIAAASRCSDKILHIIEFFTNINKEIGRRIYPCKHMWMNEEIPAGLDFAFALALYNPNRMITLSNYLLYTDPDHQVYQVDCIDALVQKHGITQDTVALIASYAMHGCHGYDYATDIISDSLFSDTLNKPEYAQIFLTRLEAINQLSKHPGLYDDTLDDFRKLFVNTQ